MDEQNVSRSLSYDRIVDYASVNGKLFFIARIGDIRHVMDENGMSKISTSSEIRDILPVNGSRAIQVKKPDGYYIHYHNHKGKDL